MTPLITLAQRLVRVALCVACVLSIARAQEPLDPRARWEQLAPHERKALRERFEAWQRMSPEERRGVAERFERLKSAERGARERLSNEGAPELDERARRDAVRGMAERELAERGRAMREMLPRELREELERSTPAERERLLDQFRERVRRDRTEHALRDLARRLDLPRDEVERVRALPAEQREREVLSLERRAIERDIERHGMPPWLDEAEWQALRALEAPQFVERWHSRARQAGFKRFEGPRDDPRARGGETQRRLDPARARQVFERLRPDPRWFAELAKKDPETRRATIETRLRERALEFLERAPDVIDARQLDELKKLEGRDFMRRLGDLLHDVAPPPPPGEGPAGPRVHELIPAPKPPPHPGGERRER